MTLKDLLEKRANVWAQAQDFNERHKKGEDMSAEDEAAWSRALAEVDELGAKIDTRQKAENLERQFEKIDEETIVVTPDGQRTVDAEQKYRSAFEKFVRFGMNRLDADERALLEANDKRAQSTSTTAGGYTVPQGFWAKVTETMKYFGGIEPFAEIIETDAGNTLPWPTADDTGNVGAILAENTQIGAQDVTFGQKSLGSYMYTSKLILMSLQLLQDTGIDLEAFLARRVGERIGRILNTHFTTGTGTAQPQGLITGATVGKTAAGVAAITFNELIDLVHSVDVAYRQSGRCRFELHDLTLAYVRKIRDDSGGAGLGRPIWEPSVQVGVPDSLLGYAVTVNNDMATLATGNKTVGFGDVQAAYVARKVNGGELMRLAERYADYLQVGFFGFQRADGLVQDASAFKVLQQA